MGGGAMMEKAQIRIRLFINRKENKLHLLRNGGFWPSGTTDQDGAPVLLYKLHGTIAGCVHDGPVCIIIQNKLYLFRYATITDLALLKIPKGYTQDIAPICYAQNAPRVTHSNKPVVGSRIGLVGFGARQSGSLMHGFYGKWLSGNYATIARLVSGLILADSSDVKTARGDMGGSAFLEENDRKCIVGVIFNFDIRTKMTTVVDLETKLEWINKITQ